MVLNLMIRDKNFHFFYENSHRLRYEQNAMIYFEHK
jgi:hypothetical protein